MNPPDYSMAVDVVDRNNRPIGRARRGDLLLQKKNFRTVHVILKDERGEFLLQKLPMNHNRSPQKLGSSVAGYVKAGENYREAAARKTFSELGLHTKLKWVGIVKMQDEESLKYIGVFEGVALEKPRYDPQEIDQILRVSPSGVQKLMLKDPQSFTATFLCIYGKLRSRLF